MSSQQSERALSARDNEDFNPIYVHVMTRGGAADHDAGRPGEAICGYVFSIESRAVDVGSNGGRPVRVCPDCDLISLTMRGTPISL